uniref:Uncharacterized protein n=1 Tax=viral metagenome TaxID=1070528 RepID=A0A6C0CGI5_9ZZZZ
MCRTVWFTIVVGGNTCWFTVTVLYGHDNSYSLNQNALEMLMEIFPAMGIEEIVLSDHNGNPFREEDLRLENNDRFTINQVRIGDVWYQETGGPTIYSVPLFPPSLHSLKMQPSGSVLTVGRVLPDGKLNADECTFRCVENMRVLAYVLHGSCKGNTDVWKGCEAIRISDANMILSDDNDPAPSNGSIVVINHVRKNGIWHVVCPSICPAEEKRCAWCFRPNAPEKCKILPEEGYTRYCDKVCQKAHWPSQRK